MTADLLAFHIVLIKLIIHIANSYNSRNGTMDVQHDAKDKRCFDVVCFPRAFVTLCQCVV